MNNEDGQTTFAIPEEHHQRRAETVDDIITNEEYAQRFQQFVQESRPLTVTAEHLADPTALVEQVIVTGKKCVICLDTDQENKGRLQSEFSRRGIKIYQIVTDYDIPYAPPFTNEGSQKPLDFEGCIVIYPNGSKDQPSTTPERVSEITDQKTAEITREQSETFVKQFCTWRTLLQSDKE